MDIDEARKRIDGWFPELAATGYEPKSESSVNYNCIAWAVGESHRRLDPAAGYFWPPGIPRDEKTETLIKVFEIFGFRLLLEKLASSEITFEVEVEKVALYADGTSWTHAARQLPNGRWTSKLGDMEDIEHEKLEGFARSMGILIA